jgi:hypothetical protein
MGGESRHLITDYRNIPGEHCGSTAMRNLVFHYCGLDLSEEEIFGLGSGIDLMLIENEAFIPGIVLFGRGPMLEADVGDALGIDYREQIEPDDEKAWEVVKAEVAAGRPTMLSGDALYLDYRDFKVHFPSHRFVLLGFDDDRQVAFVADRIDVETQECSYDALANSRNPKDFVSTVNQWGRFENCEPKRSLPDAFRRAIAKSAARMTGDDKSHVADYAGADDNDGENRATSGLAAFARFSEVLGLLPDHARGGEIARYAGSCIEAFGTGGGNFRNLFAGFLSKARTTVPDAVPEASPALAAEASRAWTQISERLSAFSKSGETSELDAAKEHVSRAAATETKLFEDLAEASRT